MTDDGKICDNDTQEGHVEVRSDSDDVHVNDEAAAPTSMDEIARVAGYGCATMVRITIPPAVRKKYLLSRSSSRKCQT